MSGRDLAAGAALYAIGLSLCLTMMEEQGAVTCISSLMMVAQAAHLVAVERREGMQTEKEIRP